MISRKEFDVVIIGGGITGGGYLYTLAKYTNVKSICLIERESGYGLINTHFNSNSQTLHVGDIETNYTKQKSAQVKKQTDPLIKYLEHNTTGCFLKQGKMVIAVGTKEVVELRERYADPEFQALYPGLRLIERNEIASIEPKIMEGRNPKEEIIALYTPDGYTVNFQAVAASFADNAQKVSGKHIETHLNCGMQSITKKGKGYEITTADGQIIFAKTVVVATSSHSLTYAKQFGYGKHLGLFAIGGNFYYVDSQSLLLSKVYTVQAPGLPFAAKHGDPEINDQSTTRFGPTAKLLPFMFQLVWTKKGFKTAVKIMSDPVLVKFMIKNMFYDIPLIGKYFVLRELRKIIPTLKYSDLKQSTDAHGIRGQIWNAETGKLEMGDVCIEGYNILFEVTPSPGASVCLGNAYKGVQKIIKFLGEGYSFDQAAWDRDFNN